MIGVVVSDKMDKTVVVKVEKTKLHPKFKKYYKFHKKYKAHDENNQCREGDLVMIQESRPLSKEKKWRVIKILGRLKEDIKEEDKNEELDVVEEMGKEKEEKDEIKEIEQESESKIKTENETEKESI